VVQQMMVWFAETLFFHAPIGIENGKFVFIKNCEGLTSLKNLNHMPKLLGYTFIILLGNYAELALKVQIWYFIYLQRLLTHE